MTPATQTTFGGDWDFDLTVGDPPQAPAPGQISAQRARSLIRLALRPEA